jgi:hypothetical protein
LTAPPAASGTSPAALLSALSGERLLAADRRYPKWATMCQLRRLGLPVLDAVLITPGRDRHVLDAAVTALAAATGQDRLMVRSDGGTETRRYYKGGNTFPLDTAASKAAGLLEAGRAVILMEPTNRFTNRLTALLRMDRTGSSPDGTFTIEALGPGYDVADLTRGGIPPQVTVTAQVDWQSYPDLWWSDLRLTSDTGPDAQQRRRTQRLARIAADILTDTCHLTGKPAPAEEQTAAAEDWLREHGYHQLWQAFDLKAAVAWHARRWFDDAFMIAVCHPRRNWNCLATATSHLGDRAIYWDIVDGRHKYATEGRV